MNFNLPFLFCFVFFERIKYGNLNVKTLVFVDFKTKLVLFSQQQQQQQRSQNLYIFIFIFFCHLRDFFQDFFLFLFYNCEEIFHGKTTTTTTTNIILSICLRTLQNPNKDTILTILIPNIIVIIKLENEKENENEIFSQVSFLIRIKHKI